MTEVDGIQEWSVIADDFKDTLIVGNGGSIALSESFSYTSLYKLGVQSGEIKSSTQEIFQKFSVTNDFGKVLRRLWETDFINEKFKVAKKEKMKVRKPYTDVRRALINTVKDIHPDQEQFVEGLSNIRQFCAKFTNVFSLNYDLTLIWAIEASNNKALAKGFGDGFSPKKSNSNLSTFVYQGRIDDGDTGVYYLHGNLCLRQTKATREEKKLASEDKSHALLKQLTDYWANNGVQPLFVCEGNSQEKLSSIKQSHYLSAAYERLKVDRSESLAIYGWSISKGDQHILDAIKLNPNLERVAVSVFRDNKKFQDDVRRVLKEMRIKSIHFFNSESSGCWANREQSVLI